MKKYAKIKTCRIVMASEKDMLEFNQYMKSDIMP